MTLYLSRLALARLVFYHSPALASQYYLDAIQGRWQIDPNDFQAMCEVSDYHFVPSLASASDLHPFCHPLFFLTCAVCTFHPLLVIVLDGDHRLSSSGIGTLQAPPEHPSKD